MLGEILREILVGFAWLRVGNIPVLVIVGLRFEQVVYLILNLAYCVDHVIDRAEQSLYLELELCNTLGLAKRF